MNRRRRKETLPAGRVFFHSVLSGFLLAAVLLLYAGPASAASDLDGHWAEEAVSVLAAHGGMQGYPDGSFRPEQTVTRAEFAALVQRSFDAARAAGGPVPFTDVKTVPWALPAIQTAWNLGWMRGDPDGRFRPFAPVRRDEAVVVLDRILHPEAAGGPSDGSGAGSGGNPGAGTEWAAQAIDRALSEGWASGFPDGGFGRGQALTRAQAASLVVRVLDRMGLAYERVGLRAQAAPGKIVLETPNGTWSADAGKAVWFLDGRRQSAPPPLLAGDWAGVVLDADAEPALISIRRRSLRAVVVGRDAAGLRVREAGGGERYLPLTSSSRITDGLGRSISVEAGDEVDLLLDWYGRSVVRATLIGLDPVSGMVFGARAAAGPPDGEYGASVARGAERMQVDALRRRLAVDGSGVTLAVIDTGVDVTHPAFDPGRVVDWIDRSGLGTLEERAARAPGSRPAEGDLPVTLESAADGDGLIIGGLRLGLPDGFRSVSGVYRYAYLEEQGLAPESPLQGDLNNNGRVGERYLVVLADSRRQGVYDLVLVDTDGDRSLEDERPLRAWREGRQTARFGGEDRQGPGFVVTAVDPAGRLVNFGLDANGHGTHVAGIAAGRQPGRFEGIAPGASLLVVKALSGDGGGSWRSISGAILEAAESGADIISVSISGSRAIAASDSFESRFLRNVARQYGVLIVIAAGNNGPGLGTVDSPGDPAWNLTVGAWIDATGAAEDFGAPGGRDGIWSFSGNGPRVDGALGPQVIAPGHATAPVPFWLNGDGYARFEGTSVAVPHAAGAAAVLWQALRETPGRNDPSARQVKALLEETARPLPDAGWFEQGFGLIDVDAAQRRWASAARWADPATARVTSGRLTDSGWPAQDFNLPVRVRVDAAGASARQLRWRSTGDIRLAGPQQTSLPATGGAEAAWTPVMAPGRGYAAGLLTGDDAGTLGLDAVLPLLFIRPATLGAGGAAESDGGRLEALQRERYFFRLEPGVRNLRLELHASWRGDDSGAVAAQDLADVYVYDPIGNSFSLAPGDTPGRLSEEWAYPAPGIWEVVVDGTPLLGGAGPGSVDYTLTAAAEGVHVEVQQVLLLPAAGGSASSEVSVIPFGGPWSGGIDWVEPAKGDWVMFRERMTATEEEPLLYLIPSFGDDVLRLRASVTQPAPRVPLDLFLYRVPNGSDELHEVARSRREDAAAGAYLSVDRPGAGRYALWVEAPGSREPVSFELRYDILKGQPQRVEARVEEGASGFRHKFVIGSGDGLSDGAEGWVLVDDGEDRPALAGIPVATAGRMPSVSAGAPILDPGPDVPLALYVRDRDGRPYSGRLRIGEGEAEVRDGRVMLRVSTGEPAGDLVLPVRMLEGGRIVLDERLTIPVRLR